MYEPIPTSKVDELPAVNPDDPHAYGWSPMVLAYSATYRAWFIAAYRPDSGEWSADIRLVGGYEWEVESLGEVTHWMPLPNTPQ